MIVKKYLINLTMDFADLLKTSRTAVKPKLSFKKLSENIGGVCSAAYLNQIEKRRYKGKKGKFMRPSDEIVLALASYFNWDAEQALLLATQTPIENSIPEELQGIDLHSLNEKGLKLLRYYAELLLLDETNRAEITESVEASVTETNTPPSFMAKETFEKLFGTTSRIDREKEKPAKK